MEKTPGRKPRGFDFLVAGTGFKNYLISAPWVEKTALPLLFQVEILGKSQSDGFAKIFILWRIKFLRRTGTTIGNRSRLHPAGPVPHEIHIPKRFSNFHVPPFRRKRMRTPPPLSGTIREGLPRYHRSSTLSSANSPKVFTLLKWRAGNFPDSAAICSNFFSGRIWICRPGSVRRSPGGKFSLETRIREVYQRSEPPHLFTVGIIRGQQRRFFQIRSVSRFERRRQNRRPLGRHISSRIECTNDLSIRPV